MESYLSYVGVAGSAVSMMTTLYFWLVRMRREQPCLMPYLADKEFFLGISRDGVRQLGVKAGVIVANHSILPNALLGARLWVRVSDGWQEVGNLAFDKQTPLPFNIPPLQTALVRLTGTLSFPYTDALEEGSKTTANYRNEFLSQPLEMKLELRHLSERAQAHVLTCQGEDGRAAQEPRLYSSAA
jgi:hypothetical protein